MKTDFLKQLGIDDQNIINSIMAENGRDIENAKKDYAAVVTKVEGLEAQLNERDTQLKELKKIVKDNEELAGKISELETSNANMKAEYESKLDALRKENEIESKLRDAKAKNIKAVRALLNDEEDLDKQIKSLKENEDSSFLFESKNEVPPAGTTPREGAQNTPKTELGFADAISAALGKMKG